MAVSDPNKVCYLYWIHLSDHSDMSSQGYIGVTTESPEHRYKRHVWDAKSGRSSNTNIMKAILKYGDELIVTTLLVASRQYCSDMESKLRPDKFTGWNVAPGGFGGSLGREGKPHTDETKSKISKAQVGRKVSKETCNRISESKRGKPAHPDIVKGCKKYFAEVWKPWDSVFANQGVWLCADIAYTLVTETGIGATSLANFLGVPDSKTCTIVKKIKQGWNPLIDPAWVAFKEKENICL